MSILEHEDLSEMILEYLRAADMEKVAESMQQEIKSSFPLNLDKYVQKKHKAFTKGIEIPRLIALKKSGYQLNRR